MQFVLLRRKITVLPEDFSYTWQAASNKDPAILNVNTSEKVFIDVFAKHLDITQIHSDLDLSAKLRIVIIHLILFLQLEVTLFKLHD